MANAHPSEPAYKVVVEKDQAMRTRDGVCLRADVYRPDAPGRFPVLLVRTPYDKGAGMALTEKDYFPPRGYVVVANNIGLMPGFLNSNPVPGLPPTYSWHPAANVSRGEMAITILRWRDIFLQ